MSHPSQFAIIIHAPQISTGIQALLQELVLFLVEQAFPSYLLCTSAVAHAVTLSSAQLDSAKLHVTVLEEFTCFKNVLRDAIEAAPCCVNNITFITTSEKGEEIDIARHAGLQQTLPLPPSPAPADARLQLSLTLLQIAAGIKAATGSVCVGYTMKAPRQHDLMRQGLLPLMPTDDVFFIPVDVATTAHVAALQCLDVLLLKPTDLLERYPGSGVVPPFASSLQRLEAAVRCGTRAVVVGSLDDVHAIVDRDKMSTALEAACSTLRDRGYRARTAAWAVTGSLEPHALRHAAESAGISPPCFIKPLLACGNPEAHAMAVVCRFKDSRDDGLRHVPCPAVVQEFIHHGGVLWKVYVAGGHVFVKQRPSLPDIDAQGAEGDDDEESCASTTSPWAVTFHSLQEMPTRWPWKGQSTEDSDPKTGVSTKVLSEQIYAKSGVLSKSEDEGGLEQRDAVLRELAKELQARLRLGLFGFDVLFDAKDGCPVVVDVNYFPSYKDIPGAASAVRAMLKAAMHECKNTDRRTPVA